jgi:hypothetical protein
MPLSDEICYPCAVLLFIFPSRVLQSLAENHSDGTLHLTSGFVFPLIEGDFESSQPEGLCCKNKAHQIRCDQKDEKKSMMTTQAPFKITSIGL